MSTIDFNKMRFETVSRLESMLHLHDSIKIKNLFNRLTLYTLIVQVF